MKIFWLRVVKIVSLGMTVYGGTAVAAAWTGEVSNPTNACFVRGAPVTVTLSVTGLAPNAEVPLDIGIYDEKDGLRMRMAGRVSADAAGNGSGTFRMPSDHYGFYRVRPRVDGKLILPKRGSCPAGCLTYAVLHDPAKRRLYPQDATFFGLHGCTAGQAPWMGARIGHGYGTPHDYTPYEQFRADYEAGRIAWKQYGFINANGVAEGKFRSLFPEAAQAFAKTNRNQWAWFGDPVREQWFSEAMENLARKVRSRDYGRAHGYVKRIYEIEWEPELSCPSREMIVRRAKLSHAAIHRADPEAIVAGPTLSVIGTVSTTRWLFEHGLAEGIDAFAVHAYNTCPPESNDFIQHVRAVRSLVREYLGPNALIIGTEDGCLREAKVPAEIEQMHGMTRKMLIMLGEGFAFNCPFYGYDHSSTCLGDYGFCYNLCLPKQQWGPPRIAPRPVFAALSSASWYLEGHRPTCTIGWLGETIHGYAYEDGDGDCVLALWDWGGNTPEIRLPVGCSSVTVADDCGNERRVETPGGTLSLTLGDAPQYVTGVSRKVWGKDAQRKLNWSSRKFRSAREDAPLRIRRVTPVFRDGNPGVRVTVENTSGSENDGMLATRIYGKPGARHSQPLKLASGRLLVADIPFGSLEIDPFETVSVEVSVSPRQGLRDELKVPVNFFAVPKTPAVKSRTPERYHEVPERITEGASYHTGRADASVRMAASWDENFLHLDIVTEDDSFCQKEHAWHTWKGDCLQLGFARDRDVRSSANSYADDLERAFSEMSVALTETGPEVCRTCTWELTKYPISGMHDLKGMVSLAEMPVTIDRTDLPQGGVRLQYRVAVPWKFLNIQKPEPGLTVYFAATANDLDAGASGRQSRLGIFELKNARPRGFGMLTLE